MLNGSDISSDGEVTGSEELASTQSNSAQEASAGLSIMPVLGIPEIRSGDVLATILLAHAQLAENDVLVVTQKIVSKAEGQVVALEAGENAKMQLVRGQAKRILRQRGSLLITETNHGFVCANAGIDLSNTDDGTACLLPKDPDRSARRIRDGIKARAGLQIAVIISDTFGRPWRQGATDIAIGIAGICGTVDLRGTLDANGRVLAGSEICIADEIAGAADLVMGKSAHIPAAIVRGVDSRWLRESSVATSIVRSAQEDLFR